MEQIAVPALTGLGLRLVELDLSGRRKPKVKVVISKRGGVTMDDCEKASRAVAHEFDRLDPLPGSYLLEVTSPGTDRPLVTAEDFADQCGRVVRMELEPETPVAEAAVPAQTAELLTVTGKILEASGGMLKIEPSSGGVLELKLERVRSARMVLPW